MTVSIADKKDFLRWYLKRYQMKRRECVWILNYLLSHDDLLNKVHFVEEAHYCPRAMVMSVTESTGVPFRFYKGNLMTADAEKSFHDLRLHPNEDMFIQLNFPNNPPSAEYLSVLEENSFMPKYLDIDEKDRKIALAVLDKMVSDRVHHVVMVEIDKALDAGDSALCARLSDALKTYQGKPTAEALHSLNALIREINTLEPA
jgi:uncharacterized protein YpiB (UPF0302 family)